jgi:DnaJ-class molecular chaperone
VRLSRNNLDDVCRPCRGLVITTDSPRPAEFRQVKITGTAFKIAVRIAAEIAAQQIAVCEDCAGSGWDSSGFDIWCPTCGGTGEPDDGYEIPSHVQVRLMHKVPVTSR